MSDSKKKLLRALAYLLLHPLRAIRIIKTYSHLNGHYKYVTILAHAHTESCYYKEKKREREMGHEQLIIQIFDGLHHSGGLTDRLKGICTLYQFAKKHNVRYKLLFENPFQLTKYLEPNCYNWTIKDDEIIRNLQYSVIYTWEKEKETEKFFLRNRDKKQLHIGCNSRECYEHYSELFNELFRPTELLENSLKPHFEALGGKGHYISISFRFQNLLGEFTEANSTALSADEQKELINKCLIEIDRIKNENPDVDKILVTSDSNRFREIATYTYTYTYIISEEVGHIDYAGAGKSKELTAFIDIFLIAGAKQAFQVRDKRMYNSDFPCMAAKLGEVPYKMIEI